MSDLREYLKLQYAGNCKCGHCNLVPVNVIETTAAEIERLTAERDAALAKVAQYEQAPVVGWKIEDWQQIYGIAGYRYLTSKQASVPREHWEGGEYDAFVSAMNAAIPLIARPEVTK